MKKSLSPVMLSAAKHLRCGGAMRLAMEMLRCAQHDITNLPPDVMLSAAKHLCRWHTNCPAMEMLRCAQHDIAQATASLSSIPGQRRRDPSLRSG